jgi:hypothetical protein
MAFDGGINGSSILWYLKPFFSPVRPIRKEKKRERNRGGKEKIIVRALMAGG